MSSFPASFLTYIAETWRGRCRIIKLKRSFGEFLFVFFKSYDYFYEMNAFFLSKTENLCTLGLAEIRRYIRKTLTFYCKICTFANYNSVVSFQKHDIYFDGVCVKRATENDGHLGPGQRNTLSFDFLF